MPTRLSQLHAELPGALAARIVGAGPAAGDDPLIRDVQEDSRLVGPGHLFVARPGGAVDGRDFIASAIERGAAAILTDDAASRLGGVPAILVNDPVRAGAAAAEIVHGRPSRTLAVAAVTGTNGKTTVAWMIRHLLRAAGIDCGLCGSVVLDDGGGERPAVLTTPPAPELARLLATMVDRGLRAVALEASSHGLEQGRLAGVEVDVAVFTNLTGDHLDHHGTIDAYAAAKAVLFEELAPGGLAVVNVDDPRADQVTAAAGERRIGCTLEPSRGGDRAAARAVIRSASPAGLRLELDGPFGRLGVDLPLAGRHNAMNALQAAVAAHRLGVDGPAVERGLATMPSPPGRLEPVEAGALGLTVLVDFAHTDDALANALAAVRAITPEGRSVHVVFGCGGDRDRTKRPRMGAVAAGGADRIWITSDNPRSEPPASIVEAVLAGVPAGERHRARAIVDRRAAIAAALDAAAAGDVVLVAGKGHETEQILADHRIPFDDRLVARELIAERVAARAAGRGAVVS